MALESPESYEQADKIALRKSTLSWMGLFVKDFRDPANGFPNRYWIELGYSLEDMGDDQWLDKVHPEDRERARRLLEEVKSSDKHRGHERYRVRDATGEWHWILSTGAVERDLETGDAERYVGLDFDITETHVLQEQLQVAQRLAEQRAVEAEALRSAGAVIASSLDKNDAVSRVIDELQSLMPVSAALVFESRDRELQLAADPGDAQSEAQRFQEGVGRQVLLDTMRRRAPDVFREPERADHFWLVVPLVARGEVFGVYALGRRDGKDFSGHEIRLAMSMSDYLALAFNNARLYETMRRHARVDELSGLLTRRAFFTGALEEMIAAGRSGCDVSCLLLDIDYFKAINDDFGHLVGDRAIREVARVFQDALRGGDVLGRYGGEEFCAVLPGVSRDDAIHVAERICNGVRERSIDGIPRTVTVSLGVATVSPGEEVELSPEKSLEALLSEADRQLYRAKERGRNRVESVS